MQLRDTKYAMHLKMSTQLRMQFIIIHTVHSNEGTQHTA